MGRRAHAHDARERGQALPLALVALAIGAVLVTPYLWSASTRLLASRQLDADIVEGYSSDAGAEWALWRVADDPTLTSSTTYTSTPIEPTPATINGAAFPTVQIRRVSTAGALETVSPAWQNGNGTKCYALTSTESGTIYARIESGSTNLRIALKTSCGSGGLSSLSGSSPYVLQFPGQAPGDYWLVVRNAGNSPGSLEMSYPVPTYEIHSVSGGQAVTVRAVARTGSVEVRSWQLD